MEHEYRVSNVAEYVKKKYWFLPKGMIDGLTGAILLHLLYW